MKIEKSKTGNIRSTERIEIKKFDQGAEKELLGLDNDLQIYEAKDLISQNVATLDFEDGKSGKPKSVIVKRVLDKSVIFYSEDERDINKFLD